MKREGSTAKKLLQIGTARRRSSMVSPATGKVVLIRFPFSDLSVSKLRPAAIVAAGGRGDWVLCQITSNPYGDPRAIRVTDESSRKDHYALKVFCAWQIVHGQFEPLFE